MKFFLSIPLLLLLCGGILGDAPPAWPPPSYVIERQWQNIMDYGAKGDGTTDDRAAIQAAFDACPDSGGTVFVPHSDSGFQITNTLRQPSYVRLLGVGWGSRIQMHPDSSRCILANADTVNGDTGIVVEGIYFDGAKSYSLFSDRDSADCISFINVHRSSVQNCWVTRTDADGIAFRRSTDCKILNNTLWELGEDGITVAGLGSGGNIVSGNHVAGRDSSYEAGGIPSGILCKSSEVVISSNVINDCGAAIDINNESGDTLREITVTGNLFLNSWATTVSIADGVRLVIAENTFYDCEAEGVFTWATDPVSHDINISNNTFYSQGAIAIRAASGDNYVISGNVIVASDTTAILVAGDHVTVSGNRIDSVSAGYGIHLQSSRYSSVSANLVSNVNKRGIYSEGGSGGEYATFTGNTVRLCGGPGIYLLSTDFSTLSGNISIDNDSAGIWLQGSYNNEVIGNICTSPVDSQEYGVVLSGSSKNYISNNQLGGNASDTGLLAPENNHAYANREDTLGVGTVIDFLGRIALTNIDNTARIVVTGLAADLQLNATTGIPFIDFRLDTVTIWTLQTDSASQVFSCRAGAVNRIAVTTSGAVTLNEAITLPTTDSIAGYVWATNGAGQMVWVPNDTGAGAGGEANTLVDTGTFDEASGFGLAQTKAGTELRIRGLIEGSNITISASGDTGWTIAGPAGAGTIDSFYVKDSTATVVGWVFAGDTIFIDTSSASGNLDTFYVAESTTTTVGWIASGDTIFIDTSSGAPGGTTDSVYVIFTDSASAANGNQHVNGYLTPNDTLYVDTTDQTGGGAGLWVIVGNADTVTLVGTSDTLMTLADTATYTSIETENVGGFTFLDVVKFQSYIELDDGSGNSPYLSFLDVNDDYLQILRHQSGYTQIRDNAGYIRLQTRGDQTDYIVFDTFAADVPMISTAGNCDLVVTASSGEVSFDTANLTTTGTLDVGATSVTGNIAVTGTVDGVDVAAFNTDVAGDSGSWNATADALGTAIDSTKTTDGSISEADLTISNAPTDEYALTWEASAGSGGQMTWEAQAGGGAWNWTDSTGFLVGWGGVAKSVVNDSNYFRFEGGAEFDTTAGSVSLAANAIDTSKMAHAPLGKLIRDTITAEGYITGNESITLSGDATGSGATAITVTVVDDLHDHVYSNIDATTSANWATRVSDETGTGKWVFATSPTFTGKIVADSGFFGTIALQTGDTGILNVGTANPGRVGTGEVDAHFGDSLYGYIRAGQSWFGHNYDTNYGGSFDLGEATVFANMGSPSAFEFLFFESNGDVRMAIPPSGAGYGTNFMRSGMVAGPSVWNDSIVIGTYWGFDALAMATGTDGADWGVQNNLQLLDTLFFDSGAQRDTITATEVGEFKAAYDSSQNLEGNYLAKDGGTMAGSITSTGYPLILDTIILGDDTMSADHIPAYLVRLQLHNATGITLAQGLPVYISGATGELPNADSARADNATYMPTIGLVEHDIANGADGYAVVSGKVEGLNTNGLSEGDAVYVAPTGGWTTTKPTGTDLIQNIGQISRVNPANGDIYVSGAGRVNDLPNLPDSHFWVGNASAVATAVDMTGDVTMSNAGVTSIANDVIAPAEMADADHGDVSWSSGVASVEGGIADSAAVAADAYAAHKDKDGDTIDVSAYEVQLNDEAGLYAVLSDVTDFLQLGDTADGVADAETKVVTGNGVFDFCETTKNYALNSELHTRSHTVTSTSDHTAGNYKLFHSDGSGDIQELAIGAVDKVLTSAGASSTPTWETPGAAWDWADSAGEPPFWVDSAKHALTAGGINPFIPGKLTVTGPIDRYNVKLEFDTTNIYCPHADTTLRLSIDTNEIVDAADTFQMMHPSVLYVPEGKWGYRHWFAGTPPQGLSECIHILVSNDEVTWTEFMTATDTLHNPIFCGADFDDATYTADPDIVWDENGDLFLVFSVGRIISGEFVNYLYCVSTDDGLNFSIDDTTKMIDGYYNVGNEITYDTASLGLVSPGLIMLGARDYLMYTTEDTTGNGHYVRAAWWAPRIDTTWVRAPNFDSTFLFGTTPLISDTIRISIAPYTMPTGNVIWHADELVYGTDLIVSLFNTDSGLFRPNIYMAVSTDGEYFNVVSTPLLSTTNNPTAWDYTLLYRPSGYFIVRNGEVILRMYYSAKNSALNWYTGLTDIHFGDVLHKKEGIFWNPDLLTDTLRLFYVDSTKYPGGIEIQSLEVQTSEDGEYELKFFSFTAADPPVLHDYVDTLNVGASDQRASSKEIDFENDEASLIDRGQFLYMLTPADDIQWINVSFKFHVRDWK